MRIRWTTRIALAAGVLTLMAGIATGGGQAHAAKPTTAPAVTAAVGHVTGGPLKGIMRAAGQI